MRHSKGRHSTCGTCKETDINRHESVNAPAEEVANVDLRVRTRQILSFQKFEWAGNGKYSDVICFCFVPFLILHCPWAQPGAGAMQTQHAGFFAVPQGCHC